MRAALAAVVAAMTIAAVACDAGSGSQTSSGPARHSAAAAATSATSSAAAPRSETPAAGAPFRLAHLIVVMEENRSYDDIVGAHAPYLHALIAGGASLTNFFAIRHPSEPNYLALFSGSTQGLTDDSCPHSYNAGNLGEQLRAAHHTFIGYSEALPSVGYSGCIHGRYARRHVPWTNFRNLPRAVNQPFTAFPRDYSKLPSVAFVIPDLDHDMHDGTIAQADTWLHSKLGKYATWARTHNSALLVTWDEDDKSENNQIPAIVYGAHVRHAKISGHADLFSLLRTVQWVYGLKPLARSADRAPITKIWTTR